MVLMRYLCLAKDFRSCFYDFLTHCHGVLFKLMDAVAEGPAESLKLIDCYEEPCISLVTVHSK